MCKAKGDIRPSCFPKMEDWLIWLKFRNIITLYYRAEWQFFPPNYFSGWTQGIKLNPFQYQAVPSYSVTNSKTGYQGLSYALVQNACCLRMSGDWVSLHSCNISTGILGHEIHRWLYLQINFATSCSLKLCICPLRPTW